ncbi:MAG: TetR/AcrR family transcriptional regulator [Acidimicrobiales bacterium]
MPRTKQRTQELRDHVLGEAVAMLAEDGITGFTTRKVARRAQTSTAAVYELFGDKGGLVREVFLEGFRLLRRNLDQLESSDDPLADLVRVVAAFRLFVRDNPVLAEVMFSRPFSDFAPGPPQVAVFPPLVERARRCLHAGLLAGDEADIAHVFLALVHGLATQESNGWLGTTQTSVDRRWALAVRATLDGLRTDCVGT